MIPSRQMGRSRAVCRAAAKNTGIDPEDFDKVWDEVEYMAYKYVNREVTKAFEEMDKRHHGWQRRETK